MYDSLVDDRCGLIRRLVPAAIPAHFPAGFSLTHAHLSDTTAFGRWPADSSGAGYAFADPDAELGATIGEAVERYCGNLVPPDLTRTSYTLLCQDGVAAVPPSTVRLYSSSQYASENFPAVAMGDDLVMEWARGQDLRTDREVLVPASLVWASYPGSSGRVVTNPVIQAGLSAHRTALDAVRGGLAEVIERDAMTLAWYGGAGLRELAAPAWLRSYAQGRGGTLRTRFVQFRSEFEVPVIGALVSDTRTGYLTMGASVAPDATDAAMKAFGEALQLQLLVAELDDPQSGYCAAAHHPGSPLKPWRADRAYSSSYAEDLSDAYDYGCHLQLHLDPGIQRRFLDELDGALTDEIPLEDAEPGSEQLRRWDGGVSALVGRVLERGFDIVTVDLTTAEVAAAGLTVVRVVVPGTYTNSAIGMPMIAGARFAEARRLAPTPPPSTPLPH